MEVDKATSQVLEIKLLKVLIAILFFPPVQLFAIGPDEFRIYGINGKNQEITLTPWGETEVPGKDGSETRFGLCADAGFAPVHKGSQPIFDGGTCSIKFGDSILLACEKGKGLLAGTVYKGHKHKVDPMSGTSDVSELPKIKSIYDKYLKAFGYGGIAELYECVEHCTDDVPAILIRVWHGD